MLAHLLDDYTGPDMTKLFAAAVGGDFTYQLLRDAAEDRDDLVGGREFVEDLWSRTAPFLDPDLPEKATRQFHQCFWEMYVAASLLDVGLELVPRDQRSRPEVGPDIQVRPNIWVEAVTASAGVGPDAVPPPRSGEVRAVPDEQMKLRLLSALSEKKAKLVKYRTDQTINQSDPCIVALNAALVPVAILERSLPRIVRAVFEVGNEVFAIERDTGKLVDRGHEHQPAITKLSGASVSQGLFLNGSCGEIAACLYSAADPVTGPKRLGRDFVLVHNPTADCPTKIGLIPRGLEFWVDGNHIERRDYRGG
jgi:hypothetical protein